MSPRLATVRHLLLVAAAAAVLALLLAFFWSGALPRGPVVVLGLAVGAAMGWAWWGIGRSVEHWGYAEQEEELHITSGAWFRRLVVVPYGRMQLVEVASGPLERAFKLATVTLRTASPATGASIPGLDPDEAARLRDRLTELGEARASGL